MRSKLYWLGNVAKIKIINDIATQIPVGTKTLIFDYGCGDGGD